ncbi:hypothetical protein DFH11DRAFT_1566355, partial [Phellopilus nigrolimitatus]
MYGKTYVRFERESAHSLRSIRPCPAGRRRRSCRPSPGISSSTQLRKSMRTSRQAVVEPYVWCFKVVLDSTCEEGQPLSKLRIVRLPSVSETHASLRNEIPLSNAIVYCRYTHMEARRHRRGVEHASESPGRRTNTVQEERTQRPTQEIKCKEKEKEWAN